ncbi:hypothetical protein RI054_09g47360 [Pseudoscourfieldia marina]
MLPLAAAAYVAAAAAAMPPSGDPDLFVKNREKVHWPHLHHYPVANSYDGTSFETDPRIQGNQLAHQHLRPDGTPAWTSDTEQPSSPHVTGAVARFSGAYSGSAAGSQPFSQPLPSMSPPLSSMPLGTRASTAEEGNREMTTEEGN